MQALENSGEAWDNLYGLNQFLSKPNFVLGDLLRISKNRKTFERGYTANHTLEVFVATDELEGNPVTYQKAEIKNADKIICTFYEEEPRLFKPLNVLDPKKLL